MFKLNIFKKKEKIDNFNKWIKTKNKKPEPFIKNRIPFYKKELYYTDNAKKHIKEYKTLIKSLLKLRNSKTNSEIIRENYRIIKNKNTRNSSATYIIKLKNKKYFVKEIDITDIQHEKSRIRFEHIGYAFYNLRTTDEFLAIKAIEEFGYNIIKSQLAYQDRQKAYIVYNYTDLENVQDTKILSSKEKSRIQNNLDKLTNTLNKKIYKKYNFKVGDINLKNVFIDYKNKKLYISDPYLY